ncbi:YdgH/BhsA/McbA-like domain containing protein [Brenneria salicis]|uniref:YdgH/BhsA/McbA-like domain containing protein n=1 Tax=Brenneria salicis TaxID=55214 RepID=UPI000DE87976|nr:YdgH/BhsA/McbA-like domain containing protein [Brenneria salicis]
MNAFFALLYPTAFEAQLTVIAQTAGVSSYRIVSVTGRDQLNGTAILYKYVRYYLLVLITI